LDQDTDTAARMAIEAIVIGLRQAGILGDAALQTVLESLENAARSADFNLPAVSGALRIMATNIAHGTSAP
jgi:hypothetical protein